MSLKVTRRPPWGHSICLTAGSLNFLGLRAWLSVTSAPKSFPLTFIASGLRMELSGLSKHVTTRKVCLLPLSLTHPIQGIATSPLTKLMTAFSQNKLKAWVRNVHHGLPESVSNIAQVSEFPGTMDFFFLQRKTCKKQNSSSSYGIFSQISKMYTPGRVCTPSGKEKNVMFGEGLPCANPPFHR